ncbi:MAG: threonine/serine exporter family protein, partial [Streptococcaceae bacterium]|nr:threonine/serine exporter family protein [Streptococcaceae bacterium]
MDFVWNAFLQLSFSLVATMAVCILWNVSRYVLFYCGLTGAIGWMVYWVLTQFHLSIPLAAVAGSVVVAIVSNHYSRKCKMPVTVFNIPGIVPLVPGGLAYEAMKDLANGDYQHFMQTSVQTAMVAVAIAIGLILAEILNHNIRSFL